MDFYMYHGRLSEDSGPTTEDGEPVDDWGFYAPNLIGVKGFHCTYGVDGHWNLFFVDKAARDAAFELTGWPVWDEDALTVQFSDQNDMIKRWNNERARWEYFGDWGLI